MRIHLIGIGGTGMGALAGLLREAGHEVRGSDGPLYPPMSTLLAGLGVPLFEGHRPENLDWGPDRVVVGNICRRDHPEAAAARERGLSLTSFPALLAELFLAERHVVVVAGTHGKTTTATMAAHTLHSAGVDPGYLIGGIPADLPRSYAVGRPPYFVVEGDEYDCAYFDKRPKFVHYRPTTVILTGVEFDHADIYPDIAAVEAAFAQLVALVPRAGRILVCADSEIAVRLCQRAACPVESYSASGATADWQATPVALEGGRQRLAVRRSDGMALDVELALTGAHNAANALAVVAMAARLGLDPQTIGGALGAFRGVRRRQEVRGVQAGVTVIDDFAHHPTAIALTLAGLRGVHGPGRLVAVFEPRSATSRRNVFQQAFVQALAAADHVVLAAPHAIEGIPAEQRLDAPRVVRDLTAAGTEARYLEEVDQIVEHLAATCRPGDTVVVMSSGGFGGLIDRLLAALAEREPAR
jgi:UDP-N-acetylmuramate: L-alanyl-gamma-D-glutamyl-meso-diaminopimelate ligase